MSSAERRCKRRFSPRPRLCQVGALPVQEDLRRAFSRWGLPVRMRVDNGVPWGSDDGHPTELACWLIGLGVEVVWNPPRRPQANGVIERSQGVAKCWAEPWTCSDAEELQRRMDETDRLQREAYAGPGELPRWQAFPALAHSGRPYRRDREDDLWNLDRVKSHLAQYVVRRKVDPLGKVSIYNRPRPVGRAWIGKVVNVGFDAEDCSWVVTADDGQELRRIEASEVNQEAVRALRMCYRVPCRPAPRVDAVGRRGETEASAL